MKLLVKFRKARAHVSEVMGVRGEERIVVAVKLEEDVEGMVALGLSDVVRIIGGKNGEKVKKRSVHGVRTMNASMKNQAQFRGGLAVVEVGRDETSQSVGLGLSKSFLDAFLVRVKHF